MIAFFDSGFGGLSVMSSVLKKIPEYDYIYLGDNARTPYGNKSQELIYKYSKEAVDFLFSEGAELVVIACNTVSARALRRLQQEYLPKKYPNKKVLGVVVPMVESLLELKNTKICGILGTKSTIESGVYNEELKKHKNNIKIINQPCPLLVPLIEEGKTKHRATKIFLKEYLKPLKKENIDTVVLACTHYNLMLKEIKNRFNKKVKIINSDVLVDKLIEYLKKHPEIEKKIQKQQGRLYYTSGDVLQFKKLGTKFLGTKLETVKQVEF